MSAAAPKPGTGVHLAFKPLSARGGLGVPSPCVGVCRIAPASQLCSGCGRSLEEIAAWSRLDEASKQRIWAALPQRGFPGLPAES
jgi:predicted Fe-S protein YdhL (DUF1289 family)